VRTIAQRELRNDSGAVLRAAEAGEEITITVDGRPVATLGPHRRRQWLQRSEAAELFATPSDETLLLDVRRAAPDAPDDPWARG
jgi:prevent-host-death family protein